MKSKFVLAIMAMAMISCGGAKQADENTEAADAQDVEEVSFVDGTWRLNDYAGAAEVQVPDSTENYYLTFDKEAQSFNLTTDCNQIGGRYTINGDSIVFTNLMSTKMACPSENVERAMSTILPTISTYALFNDSVLSLRSDGRIMATFTLAPTEE